MSAVEFSLTNEEWERLDAVLGAICPDDLVNPPLLFYPVPGTDRLPHWSFLGHDGTLVGVEHEAEPGVGRGPFGAFFHLPTLLLRHGALLARLEGDCCLVADSEGYAHLVAGQGSVSVMDRPGRGQMGPPGGPPMPAELCPLAERVLEAGAMYRALTVAGVWPVEVLSDAESPVLEVAIEGDHLAFGVNWRSHGLYRATHRAPIHEQGHAEGHSGGEASIGFRHQTLQRLLANATEPGDLVTVRIFDAWLCVQTDHWTAWAEQVEVGESTVMAEVADLLENVSVGYRWLSRSSMAVLSDPEVRIEAFLIDDGELGYLRISTVLATSVTTSPELRHCTDGLASAGIGLSVWIEDDRVVAATDLTTDRLADLPTRLESFHRRVEGLDILVTDMAGAVQTELFSTSEGPAGA